MPPDELLPLALRGSAALATSARFLHAMGLRRPGPLRRAPAEQIVTAASMLARLMGVDAAAVRAMEGGALTALHREALALIARLRRFLVGTHKLTPAAALLASGDDVTNGAVDHLNRLTGVAVPVIQTLDLRALLSLADHARTCVTLYRDLLVAVGGVPSAAAFASTVNVAEARGLAVAAVHAAAAIPSNISAFQSAKAAVIDRVIAVETIRRATTVLGGSSGVSLAKLRQHALPSLRRIAIAQLARVRQLPRSTIEQSTRSLFDLAKQTANASQQVADLGLFLVSLGTMDVMEARRARIADLTDGAVLEIVRVLRERAKRSVASALGRRQTFRTFDEIRVLPLHGIWRLALNLTDHGRIAAVRVNRSDGVTSRATQRAAMRRLRQFVQLELATHDLLTAPSPTLHPSCPIPPHVPRAYVARAARAAAERGHPAGRTAALPRRDGSASDGASHEDETQRPAQHGN